jgi:Heparinase II/III-like protein
VNPDGVSFEASLAYHGLALELFLIARHVGDRIGNGFSPGFDDALRRMLDVSRSVRHADGRIPLFGDQDSGRILPAGFRRPPTHDNLLWLGAALLHDDAPAEDLPDEEVAWTFGPDAWLHASTLPRARPMRTRGFTSSGVFVLGSRRLHLVVRCGDVGQHGSGGHSHNDLLSYELSIDGYPLVVDAGTYAYTFDVAERNRFRSTRAHNTVVVDQEDIHPIDPDRVFELRQFAHPAVEVWSTASNRIVLTASHDGYRRLRPPVLHRRTFELDTDADELLIADELLGEGSHVVESLLHLHPETVVTTLTPGRFELRRGEVAVTVEFAAGTLDATTEEGWVSDRYGVRERAVVIVARGRVDCPAVSSYSLTCAPARPATGERRHAVSEVPPRPSP